MSQIYAGSSLFFANRTGNHNWLDNNARPILSDITTKKSGKKRYRDYFLNTDAATVTVAKNGKVTITFDATVAKPLFRFLDKE